MTEMTETNDAPLLVDTLLVDQRRLYRWGRAHGFPRLAIGYASSTHNSAYRTPYLWLCAGEDQWRKVRGWTATDVARGLAAIVAEDTHEQLRSEKVG